MVLELNFSITFHRQQVSRKQKRPTQRAPDVWDSAAFSGIFLALGLYCPQSESTLRPHAGNANRWAVPCKTKLNFSKQETL